MKRKFKTALVLSILAFFPLFSNNASADEKEPKEPIVCVNARIICANGSGTNYSGCGTLEEVVDDLIVVYDYFCGE